MNIERAKHHLPLIEKLLSFKQYKSKEEIFNFLNELEFKDDLVVIASIMHIERDHRRHLINAQINNEDFNPVKTFKKTCEYLEDDRERRDIIDEIIEYLEKDYLEKGMKILGLHDTTK